MDRYSHVSGSSVDSKRRQLERSTTEYFEEPPHLSDVMTSPDHSPDSSPRPVARFHQYHQYHHDYDNQPFGEHYVVVDEDVVDDGHMVRSERRFHHQTRRVDHHSDRMMHLGRETYSVAETEMSKWARRQ